MKQIFINSICFGRKFFFKAFLISLLCFNFITLKAQQYTEDFSTAPAFTAYPGVPSWLETATVTLGGDIYEFSNAGNGGWEYVTTGGVGNSANLLYSTAATTFVTIQRQDGKRFQFYGAWLKYTNFTNGYSAPWLTVTYEGSTLPQETYGSNTTVLFTRNENVTSVTFNFSGLYNLNFDNIVVGPAVPIAPVLSTDVVSIFSDTAATFGGSVTDDGGAPVTESGIVYGTSPSPTTADSKLALSTGVNSFSQAVNGLQKNTTYYVRSYGINSAGTSYGDEQSFTTFGTFVMSGTHDFNTEWVSTLYQPSPFTKYVEGWDATGVGSVDGFISVTRLTDDDAAEGAASLRISDDAYPESLMYMSMKPYDGSVFNLQSFLFRYDVQDLGTSFGTITVTGYKNGLPVPGAVQNILNIAPSSVEASYHTFTASNNIFDSIDEFRLTASNPTEGAAVYDFDIDVITAIADGTLPVTFTSVSAYQGNSGIWVKWNVATESNVNHYEIEKSQNGQQFVKAGQVSPKANNFSSASYSWFDPNVYNGNNYYRIKSVFNAGGANSSQIVNVAITDRAGILIYPNPVTSNAINLQLNNQPAGMYTIQLFNNAGQQLYNKTIDHNGGSATETLVMDNNFIKGIYLLKVIGVSKSYTQKIIRE